MHPTPSQTIPQVRLFGDGRRCKVPYPQHVVVSNGDDAFFRLMIIHVEQLLVVGDRKSGNERSSFFGVAMIPPVYLYLLRASEAKFIALLNHSNSPCVSWKNLKQLHRRIGPNTSTTLAAAVTPVSGDKPASMLRDGVAGPTTSDCFHCVVGRLPKQRSVHREAGLLPRHALVRRSRAWYQQNKNAFAAPVTKIRISGDCESGVIVNVVLMLLYRRFAFVFQRMMLLVKQIAQIFPGEGESYHFSHALAHSLERCEVYGSKMRHYEEDDMLHH